MVHYPSYMDQLAQLRHDQALSQIASRLISGHSRSKIAAEANLRPEKLEEVLHSEAFITLLSEQDGELAADLLAERDAEEEGGIELILQAQAEAARTLINTMKYSESDNQKRGAAKDIIELAEKLKGKDGGPSNKMTFPPNQLRYLNEAAREMDRAVES